MREHDNPSVKEGHFSTEIAVSLPYCLGGKVYILPWNLRQQVSKSRSSNTFVYWMTSSYPALHPYYPWPFLSSNSPCDLPPLSDWTLHGYWPM